MLDPQIADLVRKMIEVRFAECDERLEKDITRIKAEMASRGTLRSGMTFQRIYELCAHEISIRAMIVWQVFKRIISSVGVCPSETLAADLKDELEKYLPPDLPRLNRIMEEAAGLTQHPEPRSLAEPRGQALQRIGAEIDLFVLEMERLQEEAGKAAAVAGATYNFHAPVGAVQTGPGAAASIVQTLTREDKRYLLQALDGLIEVLRGFETVNGFKQEELVEVIRECRAEVGKPEPNRLKLGSALTTVATTIQTVASLQPAYQTLKAALLPLGIFLP